MSTASGLPRGLEFVALSSPPHREDNPMSNTKTIPQEEPETYVLEPKEYDILLGRGTGPNIHEGNIKFRDEINARKTEYNATSNRATKSSIARTIINTVTGRFLKKLDGQEVKALKTKLSKTISKSISKSDFKEKLLKTEDIYVVVEDDFTITEKAKQTLRQNAKLRSSPIKQSTSSPTTTTTTTITSTALREKPSGIAVIAAAAAAAAKQSPQASKSTTAAVAIDRKSTAAGASKKRPRSETEVQHLPVATAIPGPPPPAPPHVYPHMHSMKRPFRWETEKGRALMEDFKKGSPLLWGSYARMLAEKGWHDSFDEGQFSMAVQHPVEAWRKHHHGLCKFSRSQLF